MKKNAAKGHEKTNPKQTQFSEGQKMNVSSILTKHYENIRPCGAPENKPKTNPISLMPKMNATTFPTWTYQNQPRSGSKSNSNPILQQEPGGSVKVRYTNRQDMRGMSAVKGWLYVNTGKIHACPIGGTSIDELCLIMTHLHRGHHP